MLAIGEAAEFLGVSIQTLRRWDLSDHLPSFRPNPGGNRYYRKEDLELFLKDIAAIGWKWVTSDMAYDPNSEFYCPTSDIFRARLDRVAADLEKRKDFESDFSSLVAVAGEIGNNSYDHNLGNWPDVCGIFFAYDLIKKQIVLADRGLGILETLRKVRPKLISHREALVVAFTEIITSRFPERRGNGLKFVRQIIFNNPLELTFRTGDAQLHLEQGDSDLGIGELSEPFHGCYAVVKFK